MTDWRKIVSEYHDKVLGQSGGKLLTLEGASNSSVDELQQALGFDLAEEFRSLYLQCNGFGLTNGADDQKDWFFHPIDQISGFAGDTRKWFEETHPESAARFFPFVDWGNGDGMGYLLDENGQVLDGLFWFEHEYYEFDEDQEFDEFVVKRNNTIHELLTEGAGIVG